MMLWNIYGHIIIISIGVPIISGVVANFRERKIQSIRLASLEKVKNDGEAILHLLQIEQMVAEYCSSIEMTSLNNDINYNITSSLNNAPNGKRETRQANAK